jgi:hypothetical protein
MYDCDGPLMSKTEARFFWGGIIVLTPVVFVVMYVFHIGM